MAQADPRFVTGDDDAPDCELIGRASPAMVRSPTYVVRLLVGAVAILVGLVIAVLYEDAAAGLAYNQRLLLDALPDVLQTLVSSLGVYALVAVVGAINWVLLSQRRFRTALTLNLAALAGAALSFAAERGRGYVVVEHPRRLPGRAAERAVDPDDLHLPHPRRNGGGARPGWAVAERPVAKRLVVDHRHLHRRRVRAVHVRISRRARRPGGRHGGRRVDRHHLQDTKPGSEWSVGRRLAAAARAVAGQPGLDRPPPDEHPHLGALGGHAGGRLRHRHQSTRAQPPRRRAALPVVAAVAPEGTQGERSVGTLRGRPTTRRCHRFRPTTWASEPRGCSHSGQPGPTA